MEQNLRGAADPIQRCIARRRSAAPRRRGNRERHRARCLGRPGSRSRRKPTQFVLAKYTPAAPQDVPAVNSAARRRRRPPARGWRVLLARDFYMKVGDYAEFFNDTATKSTIDLAGLYADMADQQRHVSLWLVRVDRAYRLTDLEQELSARVTELSRLKDKQDSSGVRGSRSLIASG